MGKNNRARRAAKSKTKAKARSGGGRDGPSWETTGGGRTSGWSPPPPPDEPTVSDAELARELLDITAHARATGDRSFISGLRALQTMSFPLVCQGAEGLLRQGVAGQWRNGWQPVELHRQGRRATNGAGGRLVALAMATDDAARRATTLDARWRAQIEALDLPPVDGGSGWAQRWASEEHASTADAVAAMVEVLANILALPPLDVILPPPGAATVPPPPSGRATTVGAESNPLLARIRNLLAKAESTTFEAEATALTAKAQELMTRHAIDAALVDDRAAGTQEMPVVIRVPIDAPYVDAKSLLLQTVAHNSRCQAVFHGGLDLSTVVGFAGDVAASELLFTSLLVQAQRALADAAKHAPPGTRVRSQSYRSAFLLAYANRIGDRLREINDAVFAEVEAEQGGSFLPVLRSRTEAVDDFVSERFGELRSSRVRGGYDPAGWASGRLAAEQAELASGHLPRDAQAS